jgi:hypothetical protein
MRGYTPLPLFARWQIVKARSRRTWAKGWSEVWYDLRYLLRG